VTFRWHVRRAADATAELAPLTAAARHTGDLGGRVVLPGLNDSHTHAMRAGLDWERTLHWEDVRSLAEALARVREAAVGRQAGEWIRVVGGWHSRQLRENRLPTRAELDAAAPDHGWRRQERQPSATGWRLREDARRLSGVG
jgi:predicted amidohydrolase YtcJ